MRVGGNRWNDHQDVLTSADRGLTWTKTAWSGTFGGVRPVRVAMSATTPGNFVIMANGPGGAKSTTNNGATWQPATGLLAFSAGPFYFGQPLCADAVAGGTFYYYDEAGKVYRSADGGKTFVVINDTLPHEAWGSLKSSLGVAGSLWLSADAGGLWHSADGGATWAKSAAVSQAHLMAVGAAKLAGSLPAVYMYGIVDGKGGAFRSDDDGATWDMISDPAVAMGTNRR